MSEYILKSQLLELTKSQEVYGTVGGAEIRIYELLCWSYLTLANIFGNPSNMHI